MLFYSDVRPRSAVGMTDVARRANVSTGTVHRALHDKPGINPATRARVLAAAEALGYRPNLAARFLVSGRQLRMAVHLPPRPSFFWATLRDGIREAAAPLAPSLDLKFGTAPGSLATTEPGLTLDAMSSGLITGDPRALARQRKSASGHDVPVACVCDDAPDDGAVFSVSVDPFSIGTLAGELIGRFVPGGGQVAIVADSVAQRTHAEQFRGIASSLSRFSAHLTVAAVVESHDNEHERRRRIHEMLRAHPRLAGLYISAGDSLPILQAARQAGRLAGLTVVTTDLSPELFDWIRSGQVAATIYRRPLKQGHVALELLYEYLQTRVLPSRRRQLVTPYVVMRSNLPMVLERLDIARAATRSHWGALA